ncbi:MAG: TIGR00269 family protein [Candidatus Aenigmarchaeota archaeon]|nr:TIGR00269 family protein [Candidatus Aenigmarchaeota archaeon]
MNHTKCSFCNEKSVLFRRYEGRAYCEKHFLSSVERKVKRTIRKHQMLSREDKIAVALSGGKDSTTVLYILHLILRDWQKTKLIAITIDEGIANYKPLLINNARKFTKSLNIPHYVFSFNKEFGKTMEMQKKRKEPCTYCGIARRYLLNKKARELGIKKLCTGHNLDDEIEGIMMNYLKGDIFRASRVGGMVKPGTETGRKLFIPRIKPLREVPESEIALYAQLRAQKTPDFPLNNTSLKCPYKGGLRLEVKDFLDKMEEKYPGMKFSFLETFDKIRSYLTSSGKGVQKCEKCGEASTGKICKTCELWR